VNPILSALLSWLSLRFRRRASLELEVIALRHQLTVLQRTHRRKIMKRRLFRVSDKILWAWLYHLFPKSTHFMVLLQPSIITRWHHRGFRFYWRLKSRHDFRHNRRLNHKIIELIRQMRDANPLWGGARIHGELQKLGIRVHQRTVFKYLKRPQRCPSPGWRTFLRNEMRHTAAMDMFIVVTVTFRLLYALLILGHDRRKIIHFGITEKPNQDWLADQLSEAFRLNPPPRYLVRDRDSAYGSRFSQRVREIGIQEVRTAPYSWWQNIYVERVIGTIRRECLDHVVVVNERHLKGILDSYISYYNKTRTHLSLGNDSPEPRPIEPPATGNIIAIPEVGGLHHRYTRRRAA
jgi:putative transposase